MQLRELVEALKAELKTTVSSDPMFQLTTVKLTTKVITRDSATARGGVEFLVFRAGVDGTTAVEDAQEVTIELTPLEEITMGEAPVGKRSTRTAARDIG